MSRIIAPCCFRLPSGKWRMWYKDEKQNAATCYADSDDLYEWEYKVIDGVLTCDRNAEVDCDWRS